MARPWICAVNLLLLLVPATASGRESSFPWSVLEPGMEYRKVSVAPASGEEAGTIHFFRIDPKNWRLKLVSSREFHRESATVKFLAQQGRARLAVNGGFFGTDFKPLGLRISNGTQSNPVRNVSWWGIFAMVLGRPQVFSLREFAAPHPAAEFSVQAGPRLVVGASIPATLREGMDQRSGIGATADGLIILAVTDRAWLSLTEFAQWMRSSEGGGCTNALNLDGGHSSQLYYGSRVSEISVENTSTIVDAIGVFSK